MAGAPTIKQLQASVNRGLALDFSFVPSLKVVAGRINTLGTGVSSFKEPLRRAVKEVVIPSIRTNFEVGGRPPWEPLSPSTAEIRSRLGGNYTGRPLIKTGALFAAMASTALWRVSDVQATLPGLPANLWYGYVHQEGYGGKGGGRSAKGKSFQQIVASASKEMPVSAIPARPFAVLQPEDEDDIGDIFMEWLGDEIEKAWP